MPFTTVITVKLADYTLTAMHIPPYLSLDFRGGGIQSPLLYMVPRAYRDPTIEGLPFAGYPLSEKVPS